MELSKLKQLAESRKVVEAKSTEQDFDSLKAFVADTFDSLVKTLDDLAKFDLESDLGDLSDKIGGTAKETNSLEQMADSMKDAIDMSDEVAALKAEVQDFVQDVEIQLKTLKGLKDKARFASKMVKQRRTKIEKLMRNVML